MPIVKHFGKWTLEVTDTEVFAYKQGSPTLYTGQIRAGKITDWDSNLKPPAAVIAAALRP